jgi:hypothetical protein
MEDTISRNKLLQDLENHFEQKHNRLSFEQYDWFKRLIEEQPPADILSWIKCSERPPKQDGRYLVLYRIKNVYVAGFAMYYQNKWSGEGELKITHWMTVPVKPKENCND